MFHRVRNVERLNRGFRRGQLVSAAAFSLGHGANDAQKTMGIILAVLIASGHLPKDSDVPLWVVLAAHTAIGLGTLTGGWRIVKTMGSKITRLQPAGGVAAETAAAATLFFTSRARHPRVDHAHHHRRHRRVWVQPAACQPCGGASPGASSGRGSSRSPARWRSAT